MPPLDREKLASHLRQEISGQLELFDSLWPLYEDVADTTPPHRQRTAVNRLLGYSMFLGIDPKGKSAAAKQLQILRGWQKRLGTLRDWDVTWKWLGEFAKRDKACAVVVAEWSDSLAPEERRARWQPILDDARGLPGAEVRIARAAVGQHLNKAVDRLARGKGSFESRDALPPVVEPWAERLAKACGHHGNKELHSFRVTNKRLRFVADVLAAAGEEGPAAGAAPLLADTHTTLGNLSDLWVMRDWLLQRRANAAILSTPLPANFSSLEAVRARIEQENFDNWFELLPRLLALDLPGGPPSPGA